MQPPRPNAGHRLGHHFGGLGSALGLSLLVHGLAVAGLIRLVALAEPPDSPASVSRKREAVISVSLRRMTPRASAPPRAPRPGVMAAVRTAAPLPAPPTAPAHLAVADPQGRPSPVQTTVAPAAPDTGSPPPPLVSVDTPVNPASIDQPAEAPAQPRPPSRFANLFAPVIGRPLGRGRWQPRQQPLPPPEQTQAMQMAQTLAAARDALNQRTAQINAVLQQLPLQGSACFLRIDLPARAAHIQCAQAEDQARLQAMLEGLVRSVPPSQPLHDGICLRASPQHLDWAACPAPDTPPDMAS